MGRDHCSRAAPGEPYRRLDVALGLGRAGTLQLQIDPPGKEPRPLHCEPFRRLPMILQESSSDVALHRTGEGDQALGAFADPGLAQLGAAPVLVLEPGAGQELGQPEIARARLREQQQPVRLVALGLVRDPDVAADDGLHARRARGLVELDHAEDVGEVGDRQGRHAVRGGPRDGFVDAHDPVGDGELAVEPKVDEGGIRHRLTGNGRRENFTTRSRNLRRQFDCDRKIAACSAFRRGVVSREEFMTPIKGLVVLILVLALAPRLTAAETVYKYRRPYGSTLYSDFPLPGAKWFGRTQLVPAPTPATARTAMPERGAAKDPDELARRRVQDLDAADAAIKAAEQSLKEALERQQAGVEPQPGERLGIVGGPRGDSRSRLTPGHFARQRSLAAHGHAARAPLDDAFPP